MFLLTWLVSMVFAVVFGLFAVVTGSIISIFKRKTNVEVLGGAKWMTGNLLDTVSLTQFKESFTGGSVPR